MELTREERKQVQAHIGEMLNGEPITDGELENLARVAPVAFYVIARRKMGIMRGVSADDVLHALPLICLKICNPSFEISLGGRIRASLTLGILKSHA